MKITLKDFKKGILKVIPTTHEDLWVLSKVIEKGSLVSSITTRKIKISETKVDKKTYYLQICVEKIEFENSLLRISGKVTSDVEDIPKGSYHSLSISLHDELKIEQKWLKYQIEKIENATKDKNNILIVVFDREEVYFGKIENDGYKILSNFQGDVEKKIEGIKSKGGFYKEIEKKLKEYDQRFNANKIIVASPAFFKEDFLKQLSDEELKKKIITATCSSVSENAFTEILKRDEVKNALNEERARQESEIVEELFLEIAKDRKATYGFQQTKEKILSGNVSVLLITDNLIDKFKQENRFHEIEELIEYTEKFSGKVMIISSENDAGKRLDGISGIGAILKYKEY